MGWFDDDLLWAKQGAIGEKATEAREAAVDHHYAAREQKEQEWVEHLRQNNPEYGEAKAKLEQLQAQKQLGLISDAEFEEQADPLVVYLQQQDIINEGSARDLDWAFYSP